MIALILYSAYFDNKRILKLCISLVCSLYFGFRLNLLFDSDKCPLCYGDELCSFFQNGQIRLFWFSYFLSLINSRWTKSVFHGFFNGSRVVIKRKIGRSLENDGLNDIRGDGDEVQRVFLCPSVTNKFFLLSQINEGIERKQFWRNVKISIEPLLLMYFKSQTQWPFPKYLGACGDFIMEEYKGEPLNDFLTSDFNARTQLAIHLLKMAHLFTFGHSDLSLYFTDYSLDNLVVDSSGGIFFIDLDSVIISNKSALLGNQAKGTIHSSEILDEYNYAFSPFDICNHYISDHNYFSVCKYLLSHLEDGLLRDVPKDIKRRKELLHLLNECTLPSETGDRFSAGQQLQSLLEEIISDGASDLL